MTRVAVSKTVLRWALERSVRREDVELKFPKLSEWLSSQSQPTLRQLEAFAKATCTPLGFLFLAEPPVERLSIPHFRTLDGSMRGSSPDLLETVQTMERRQAWMREYLIEQRQEPLKFVRSVRLADEFRLVANQIRSTLGLDTQWASQQHTWTAALRELQKKMEEVGILVVVNGVVGNNNHRKLDVDEFRGFVLVDEYAPLVFVNGADGKAAQMFTLAHELAHVWLGSSAAFDLRQLQPADDATEQACNRIAAEFLVPEVEFSRFWTSITQGQDRFQMIAQQFKVSELVAARRALDIGKINRDEFLDFYRDYQERERRTTTGQEGGNFYATQNLRISRRFAETIVHAVSEGKLLYHEAYILTGLHGQTFERFVQHLVGEPL